MKKKIVMINLFLAFLLVMGSLIEASSDISVDEAKKVDRIIKRITKNRKRRSVFLRKITFTQNELNSYLNIIYLKRYVPEVKSIELKLEKNNYAAGLMKVILKGEKYKQVPAFLKDFELEFGGKVQCESYRMRYAFDKIKINGTTFSPEVLDEALGAAQVSYKVKKSIFDWFDLMPGIKNIVIDYKKITLFY